jgi:hypothetical protein
MVIRRQHVRDIALWLFALFLAWVFLRQGIAKFSDSSGWARAFRVWHFPDWFRMLIGSHGDVRSTAALDEANSVRWGRLDHRRNDRGHGHARVLGPPGAGHQ